MANFSHKQGGKEVGQASTYAQPHSMSGKVMSIKNVGIPLKMPEKKPWTPMAGVSIGNNDSVKTDGVKIRGTGAATKGVTARGPMA